VVAQPLRRAEELETLWLCVAPLRLGGLRGKKSTPSVWLGGTGELIDVGKQEQEQERPEARVRTAFSGYSPSVTGTQVGGCFKNKVNATNLYLCFAKRIL
jgi:hypothetical protein